MNVTGEAPDAIREPRWVLQHPGEIGGTLGVDGKPARRYLEARQRKLLRLR